MNDDVRDAAYILFQLVEDYGGTDFATLLDLAGLLVAVADRYWRAGWITEVTPPPATG